MSKEETRKILSITDFEKIFQENIVMTSFNKEMEEVIQEEIKNMISKYNSKNNKKEE